MSLGDISTTSCARSPAEQGERSESIPPSPDKSGKLPENRELFLLQEVRIGRWRDENPTGGFENVPGGWTQKTEKIVR